jgi:NAD(P)-dependent dehydrogenase (short-subunit alcohol dehydrogenase family)
MPSVARIAVGVIGAILCAVQAFAQSPGAQKAIVVTEQAAESAARSSSDWPPTVLRLRRARAQKDLDELNAIKNVQAVRLDVTSPSDIAAAVALVGKAGRGLYGVVNNAGVVVVAPMIEVEEKDLDFIFNVNMYGPYRITKAFAPMLLESKGRVVNISSQRYRSKSHDRRVQHEQARRGSVRRCAGGRARAVRRAGRPHRAGNYGTEIGRNLPRPHGHQVVKGSRFETQMRSTINSMRQFETIRRRTTWPMRCSTRYRATIRRCGTWLCRRRTGGDRDPEADGRDRAAEFRSQVRYSRDTLVECRRRWSGRSAGQRSSALRSG